MELLAPLRDEDDEGDFDHDFQAQFDPAALAWSTSPLPATDLTPSLLVSCCCGLSIAVCRVVSRVSSLSCPSHVPSQ